MKWRDHEKHAARHACQSWQGTPHVHRRWIKGKGVDCVHFVVAVLIEAGILEKVKRLPSYPTTWGFMSPENILAKTFVNACHAERLKFDQVDSLQFGDVVIFKAGRQSNHVGIMIDGRLWHVLSGGTVEPVLLARHVAQIQEIVRFKERGWKKQPDTIKLAES